MLADVSTNFARRMWLRNWLATGAALLAGFDHFAASCFARQAQATNPLEGGKHLGNVGFIHEPRVEMETPLGSSLDGRLYTDLSTLSSGETVVSTKKFYLRTRASDLLDISKPWQIRLGSSGARTDTLTVPELQKRARPMGRHLMECAGNSREAHFGMLSVADWAGVPLAEVLDGMPASPSSKWLLVSGFDRYSQPSATSMEGASWIFPVEQLRSAGAFFALEMNSEALTKDHGAPVRLMVPGWYGCTCIKWVNEISFVPDNAPATSQMLEFAFRTHQEGVPPLARDFHPALIQRAALPIRVEKWQVGEVVKYRVVGIAWGGTQPARELEIRFNPEEEYVAVDHLEQQPNSTWSFWWHVWTPKVPGSYAIRLHAKNPQTESARMRAGFFVRSIEITEV